MITQYHLNELTGFTNSKIAKVVLNDTVEITSFLLKSITDNILTIEYMVPRGIVAIVTKMELRSSAGAAVSTRIVNVPIVEDTIMRHVITTEEVAA